MGQHQANSFPKSIKKLFQGASHLRVVVRSIENQIDIAIHILAFFFRFQLRSGDLRFVRYLVLFIHVIIARAIIILFARSKGCDKYYSKSQFFHR